MSKRKIILWLLPILMAIAVVSSLLYEKRRMSGWSNNFSAYNATPEVFHITGIAFDTSNRPWLGNCGTCTPGSGLSTYNGENWETLSEENSGLVSNRVVKVSIDLNDRVWVGYRWYGGGDGVSVFDGETWTTYTKEDSGLISNAVDSIAIDPSNRVWIGYGEDTLGVSVFDGKPWTTYTKDNSGLVSDKIYDMVVDRAGKIWFNTSGGVSVPPENPTPIAPHLVMVRNVLFSPKLSLWVTLSLLAGLWVTGYFTVGDRTETTKRLGVSLAFGCLGFIAGPLCVGVILGLLGAGDGSLIFGILYFGALLGAVFWFLTGVYKFRSLTKKDESSS